MRAVLAVGLILAGACLAVPGVSAQTEGADVVGAWRAVEPYFPPTLLVERNAGGDLVVYLTDASQARDNPFSAAAVRGDSLLLALDRLSMTFRGRISRDGEQIVGTFTQGDRSVPLTLVPAAVDDPTRIWRPQTPLPPHPYASTDVTFASDAGVELSGTLTVPEGAGPFPGVVLLQGSGTTDRDAEIEGHRPFLVLADHLARHGVAALRYDKRDGDGPAGGARLDDLTRDAEAALRALSAQPTVDPARVGIVGHSEGGLVAPRAAGASFLVLLAAPATPIGDALAEQTPRLVAATGAPASEVDAARSVMAEVVAAARSDADSADAARRVRAAFAGAGWSGEALDGAVRAHTSRPYRDFVRYDPAPALRAVRVPTLAVVGSADLFTPPDANEPALRDALGSRGTVVVVDGVNHWLQPATTGLPDEIGRTETTVAPAVLDLLTEWITAQATAE
ncbi:alpha/beta hydrolase family protein [Rubrivirga litoralis]|uniref:Alpha/beta fold hydrolase n=1 Tax=Rubrivirga litoralis TaxID=3075598 RepID=A0ABU3BMZ4_9BACT|nr:alpha/beta fold hydrolase [Rubrivirga sp. F394]MDT0630591.1 alpha/beta fold hydrolase [Rubrivirga sp. F394]